MLTSITPLGEQGRGQQWRTTATWLVVGHLAGSAVLGLFLAASAYTRAQIVPLHGIAPVMTIAIAIGIGAVIDASGARLPGTRQVDERWLTSYRGWVYGLGFGAQLGFGVATIVNTGFLLSLVVAAIVLSPVQAFLLLVFYGLVRGLAASANGWVRSVGDLRRLHELLDRTESGVRWGAIGVVVVAAAGTFVVV